VTRPEESRPWPPQASEQDLARIRGKLDEILWDDRTPDLLRAYFDPGDGYAGRWWDPLPPDSHPPNEIGCHDLLAVTFLDVHVPGQVAGRLLYDKRYRDEVSGLLARVPTEVPLWLVDREGYAAADRLWNYFEGKGTGMGHTIISKLLARKRPDLIPVTDSVLRCGIQRPDGTDFWAGYYHVLGGATPNYVAQLTSLREVAGCSPEVTLLRVLDVAIWMTFSVGRAARTRADLSPEPWCPPDRLPPCR
jgi:hypothetical protein